MDTWATSSLTPQIQSRWSLEEQRHQKLFPMDIRPQAHEIIRTWAFYTIVKAWMHEGQVPWHHVVISGWILDPDRKKMSKSKGNVVTPEGLLDEHSVDAVRYWAGRARLGTDTAFDVGMFKIGKKLATKLFNASRFVLGQIDRAQGEAGSTPGNPAPGGGAAGQTASGFDLAAVTEPLDLAFLGRLRSVVDQSTAAFERFEYAVALQTTEDAFWSFCDDYLELVKSRSYAEEDTPGRRSAVATLHAALSVFLRLLAPFLPYVTEEVWSWRLAGEGRWRSIHTAPWPEASELAPDQARSSEAIFVAASEVLGRIRGAKSEAKKSLRWPVASLAVAASKDDLAALDVVLADVLRAGAAEGAEVRREERDAGSERFQVLVTLGEQAAE
ncbi:MAG: class I tRNA ligase family protein, partial [Candidatus Eisenbacteria bacterium]|nr:class I tRNA ligase family protein [Candidatus Eisenbacteria bacterium]